MVCMKRAVVLIVVVALALACFTVWGSRLAGCVSTFTQELSPAIEKVMREAVGMLKSELLDDKTVKRILPKLSQAIFG